MAGTRRLLAMATAFSLTAPSANSSGKVDPLGIILQADQARLGSDAVSEGMTIYDGDRLSTGADGSLRLVAGGAMFSLQGQSDAVVRGDPNGATKELEAELVSGTGVLTVAVGARGEIVADGAGIRPVAEGQGAVQVRIVGPRELVVFARRGPWEISYRDESETIAEGKCYRVLLNPARDAGSAEPPPKRAGKRRKMLILIAIGAGVAAIVLPTVLRGSGGGVESPDRP